MKSRNPLIIYTRDARVPLGADDPEMLNGWRSVPVPPTSDDCWEIADDRSDKSTSWIRRDLVAQWGRA
jgi:hypothetical protein